MEGGTWWATVPKSQTYLSNFHFHFPLRGYYRILSTIPCAIQSVLVGFIYFLHVLCLVASVMSDSATPWTVACQVPLSTEFSRQEYWSGKPFPSPGNLPTQGPNPHLLQSLALQADSSPAESWGKPKLLIRSLLWPSFYRQRNWGIKRLSKFPRSHGESVTRPDLEPSPCP